MTKQYWEVPNLDYIYLEDSWVKDIQIHPYSLIIDMDLVLCESHSLYSPPKPGEQYCYRESKLIFRNIKEVRWIMSGIASMDSSGDTDYGSIDELINKNNFYKITGDFGLIELQAGIIELEFS